MYRPFYLKSEEEEFAQLQTAAARQTRTDHIRKMPDDIFPLIYEHILSRSFCLEYNNYELANYDLTMSTTHCQAAPTTITRIGWFYERFPYESSRLLSRLMTPRQASLTSLRGACRFFMRMS